MVTKPQIFVRRFQLDIDDPIFPIVQCCHQSAHLPLLPFDHFFIHPQVFKVLTIRLIEILGMLEEAARTRMFKNVRTGPKRGWEEKRSALTRLWRSLAVLADEITRKLGTLCAERRAFMQSQMAGAELKRLARVLRTHEWTDHCAEVARRKPRSPNGNSKLTRHVARRND
jgi:hypothetical protein